MKKYVFFILIIGSFVFNGCKEDCSYPEPQYDEHAIVANASEEAFVMRCSLGDVTLQAGESSYDLESLLVENGAFRDYYLPRLGDTVWFLFGADNSVMHTRIQDGDGIRFVPTSNNILDPHSWEEIDRHDGGVPHGDNELFFDYVFTLTESDLMPNSK